MFTSLVQYLLMAPTFVNIINIYAFCNTHDGECVQRKKTRECAPSQY